MGRSGKTEKVLCFGPLGQIRFRPRARARVQVPSRRTNIDPSPPQLSKTISRHWDAMTEYPNWASVEIKGGKPPIPPCAKELHSLPRRCSPSRRWRRPLRYKAIHISTQPSPKTPDIFRGDCLASPIRVYLGSKPLAAEAIPFFYW